jgi:hypothetical protein
LPSGLNATASNPLEARIGAGLLAPSATTAGGSSPFTRLRTKTRNAVSFGAFLPSKEAGLSSAGPHDLSPDLGSFSAMATLTSSSFSV